MNLREIVKQAIDDKNEALTKANKYFIANGNDAEYLRLCKEYAVKANDLSSALLLLQLDSGE